MPSHQIPCFSMNSFSCRMASALARFHSATRASRNFCSRKLDRLTPRAFESVSNSASIDRLTAFFFEILRWMFMRIKLCAWRAFVNGSCFYAFAFGVVEGLQLYVRFIAFPRNFDFPVSRRQPLCCDAACVFDQGKGKRFTDTVAPST